MLRNYALWVLSFGLVIFQSCERSLDLSIDVPDSQLVVDCKFTPNEPFRVILTTSRSIIDTSNFYYISDAKVQLFQEDEFLENLTLDYGENEDQPAYVSQKYSTRRRAQLYD